MWCWLSARTHRSRFTYCAKRQWWKQSTVTATKDCYVWLAAHTGYLPLPLPCLLLNLYSSSSCPILFSSSAQSIIKYFVVGPITNVFLIERLQPLGWGHILGNGWKRSCSLKVSSPDSSPAQYLRTHYLHFQREKARSVSRYFTESDLSMQIQLFF